MNIYVVVIYKRTSHAVKNKTRWKVYNTNRFQRVLFFCNMNVDCDIIMFPMYYMKNRYF